MTDFVFRISRAYADVDLQELYNRCQKVVVFQHDADEEISRTHIHGLCIGCDRKEDTICNKFFKNVYDKLDYSMKTKDVNDGFITYMGKGKLAPVYCKEFDPLYVLELVQKWVEPAQKAGVRLENGKFVRVVKESIKKTKRELLELMRSEYSAHDGTRETLKKIRKVLIANNEVIGMYKVLDYYDALMMYANKGEWLTTMEQKINSRIRI